MTGWLVTGVTGLLGANAAVQLSADHPVVGLARAPHAAFAGFRGVSREKLTRIGQTAYLSADLSDPAGRDGIVESTGAGVVFHAAAIASIEACERDPELARVVNVEAAADLAAQAAATGARFVHVSTDAVFDGATGAYREDSEPSPTSVYGRTKVDAERAVLDANPEALVARVNFYGWSPIGRRSLAEFFANALRAGESPAGFEDITVSTLYVGLLVDRLAALVDRGATGIVHVVSGEPTTKYDLGVRIALALGHPADRIRRARSTDHLEIARGSRLDLSVERMERLLGTPAPGQQVGVDRLIADRDAGRREAVAAYRPETAE